MTLTTYPSIQRQGPATYSLPGDVIEVRQNLPATTPGGQTARLRMGYYVILGQCGNALVLARAAEDEDDHIIAEGIPYGVPVHVLATDAVMVTQMRAAY